MLLSCLIFFLFCSTQLKAQLTIGIKGGYSNAWEDYGDVNLPDDAEIDVKGFYISLLSYYKINKHLAIGLEPGYVQRGAACRPGWEPVFAGDTKFVLNYLELPVMIRGNFSLLKEKIEIFGKIGYGASMLQKGTEVVTSFAPINPSTIETEIDFEGKFSALNKYDHGAYAGFGFGFNLGKNQLFVEANYYHASIDFDDNNTSLNRSLQFGVGFTRFINL